MKHSRYFLAILLCLIFSFLGGCSSSTSEESGTNNAQDEVLEVGATTEEDAATSQPFGALFVGTSDGSFGATGCIQNGTNCTGTPPQPEWATFDPNWESYFSYDETSMTITANDSCRNVSTGPNNNCIFTVGDNGVTEISFDFAISGPCHAEEYGTDWLAFWIYSDPWVSTAEVDFIEACSGPIRGGLNTNFDAHGQQVGIFQQDDPNWQGTITATFSGSGSNVHVQVTNSHNNQTASTYLSKDSGYLFVLDTSPTNAKGCTVTISNLTMQGSVGSGEGCIGLVSGS